jgi:hypothetical protein
MSTKEKPSMPRAKRPLLEKSFMVMPLMARLVMA